MLHAAPATPVRSSFSRPGATSPPVPRFVPLRGQASPAARGTVDDPNPATMATTVSRGRREDLWAELGMLAEFADDETTDLLLTGSALWVDRGQGLVRRAEWPQLDEGGLRELAVRLIARGGRHLDDATPC